MREFTILAAKEEYSLRISTEKTHEYRSKFERDRDRILYSKAFRRLSGKTQIFVVGNDDHIRTRLTHTMEVSQIAITISKYLGLNETLTEAIALGHDIGHTPFGHVGERILNYIMNGCYLIKDFNRNLVSNDKGFKHNWQGLRVVVDLENLNRRYYGLNLTDYTMWGILNHSKKNYESCKRKKDINICNLLLYGTKCHNHSSNGFSIDFYKKRYEQILNEDSWTLEGLVVSIADEIAQRHHDIEDGIEEKIIDVKELIKVFSYYFKNFLRNSDKELIRYISKETEKTYYLPALSKLIVDFLTTKLINDTYKNLKSIIKQFDIKTYSDFYERKKDIKDKLGLKNLVCYENEFKNQEKKFKDYLRNRILNSHKAQSMDGKADYVIRQLFKAYITNPQQLPDKTIITLYKNLLDKEEFDFMQEKYSLAEITGKLRDKLEVDHYTKCDDKYRATLLRTICDYIAGMTDNYALQQYELLYGSRSLY